MAAVRHLEASPDHGPPPTRRHLRVVAPAAPGRVRRPHPPATYRRRRLVAGLAVGLVLGASVVAVQRTRTPGPRSGPVPGVAAVVEEAPRLHVVQPGDSYWSIASSHVTDGDIREAVDELSAANGGRALEVGDRLSLAG